MEEQQFFSNPENDIWRDSSIEKIVIEYNDIIADNTDWVCVVIKLIDGVCIRIVCETAVLVA